MKVSRKHSLLKRSMLGIISLVLVFVAIITPASGLEQSSTRGGETISLNFA
jgi:hypothetical protein